MGGQEQPGEKGKDGGAGEESESTASFQDVQVPDSLVPRNRGSEGSVLKLAPKICSGKDISAGHASITGVMQFDRG
jgi:hypothetical protein